MKLLAFDTSTERLSVAVMAGTRQWQHEGAGGRHSSAALIPACLDLLRRAGVPLAALDAIVFGRGPGSFTGLRTACSVAQGLALGAGVPVLTVDTLQAVAEQARQQQGATRVLALLDARMQQVYAAPWVWQDDAGWQLAGDTIVAAPEAVRLPPGVQGGWRVAGNAFATYAGRWPAWLQDDVRVPAWPSAGALLALAPQLLRAGTAVDAAQALPLYVRDKVAQTTAERAAATQGAGC